MAKAFRPYCGSITRRYFKDTVDTHYIQERKVNGVYTLSPSTLSPSMLVLCFKATTLYIGALLHGYPHPPILHTGALLYGYPPPLYTGALLYGMRMGLSTVVLSCTDTTPLIYTEACCVIVPPSTHGAL